MAAWCLVVRRARGRYDMVEKLPLLECDLVRRRGRALESNQGIVVPITNGIPDPLGTSHPGRLLRADALVLPSW